MVQRTPEKHLPVTSAQLQGRSRVGKNIEWQENINNLFVTYNLLMVRRGGWESDDDYVRMGITVTMYVEMSLWRVMQLLAVFIALVSYMDSVFFQKMCMCDIVSHTHTQLM